MKSISNFKHLIWERNGLMDSYNATINENLMNSIVEIAIEEFRFRRTFEKALQKLDVDDQKKYISQFLWFTKKVNAAVEKAGLRVINLEGQLYDEGMAVVPLNLDEFQTEDQKVVMQMIEPVIMDNDAILRMGSVVLGRIVR